MTQSRLQWAPGVSALVLDAQAGQRDALDQLLAGHLPLIYNVIGRALNGHADVDDLVQETMVQVIRGLPMLRDPERFRSWAVAIAYRQIHRYLRDRRKSGLRRQEAPLEMPDPGADFAERTVTELVLTGQRRELAEAARWLDDGDRQLLSLWWQEAVGELTRRELAAALAIKPPHAAVRLQRLRERLESARHVVRALRADPRCGELDGLLRGWSGVADPLWRKRLIRHTRHCDHCQVFRAGLVAPERLLLGVTALPVPVAVGEGLRVALEAATSTALAAPVAASAGQALLTQLHGLLQTKTAAAAAAVAIAAGGGFGYAVYEQPAPGGEDLALVNPTVPPPAVPPQVAAPTADPAPSAATEPATGTTTGVSSADIYLAPDGSDRNDGSADRPFATLGKAVSVVRPGQIIAMRGGTYRPSDSVVITTSGDPDRRITLSNYRDERPIIDASRVPADEWTVTHLGGYWTVQGLEIKNSGSHAYVCRSCRENVFQRLSMHDNVRSGLTLRDADTIGNQVLDSDFFNNYDPRERGRSGVGLAIKFGSGDGNVVRGCRGFDNADSGFDVGHFAGSVRLEYNWAYGNGVNRWNAADWQANADGFLLGGGSPAPAAAHVLRQNAAWDNVGRGFSDGGNPGAPELTENTGFRNGGTGFHFPVAAAVLSGNAAIGNADGATVGTDARSSRNTWDGGAWTEEIFRSTDATAAQGERRVGDRLPVTTFLAPRDAFGAAMRMP